MFVVYEVMHNELLSSPGSPDAPNRPEELFRRVVAIFDDADEATLWSEGLYDAARKAEGSAFWGFPVEEIEVGDLTRLDVLFESFLERASLFLLRRFQRSLKSGGCVAKGGPGGFPVIARGEQWNIGMTPGRTFFAGNGHNGPVEEFCHYHFDDSGKLIRNNTATPFGAGYYVDPSGHKAVESIDEVYWLTRLIDAAEMAEWGAEVELPPRPTPYRQ